MEKKNKIEVKIEGNYAVSAKITIKEDGKTVLEKEVGTFIEASEEMDSFFANYSG